MLGAGGILNAVLSPEMLRGSHCASGSHLEHLLVSATLVVRKARVHLLPRRGGARGDARSGTICGRGEIQSHSVERREAWLVVNILDVGNNELTVRHESYNRFPDV